MLKILGSILGELGSIKYAEIRFHHRKKTSIEVQKGELKQNLVDNYCGIGIRVFINNWGFATTNSFQKDSIKRAMENAVLAAKLVEKTDRDINLTAPKERLARGVFIYPPEINLPDISLEEKIEIVRKTEERVRNSSRYIHSATVLFLEYSDHKYILTSDGAEAEVKENRVDFKVSAVAGRDSDLIGAREDTGIRGRLRDIFKERSPEEIAEAAARKAVNLLSAPYPPAGEAVVILSPALTGVFAHEAMGHLVEADSVIGGAVTQGKINQKITSELVTLVDNGLPPYGQNLAVGTVLVDDEGILGQRVVIIENGVLKSYLHNRETAFKFGVPPTGNARAFEYSDQPLIRMRNTYIEPGFSSLEEMIEKTKEGYLFKTWSGGMVDVSGTFMFSAEEIYQINKGKVGRLLRGVSFSGPNCFEALKSVDMVSKEFEIKSGSGHCGKAGQLAKVDCGGPYLRCRLIIGGRKK